MSEDLNNKISGTIQKLIGFMDLDCQVEIREEKDELNRVSPVAAIYMQENARFLIGKNGQNLRALEHVIRAMLAKEEMFKNLILDINDYKKTKANQVVETARQAVAKVRSTQKPEILLPMTAYERRIVHMELASYPDITTESIGQEPQRRIMVKLYP